MNMLPNKLVMEAEKVTKLFGKGRTVGIVDVSFRLNQGEVVCLVGPSGSGKTTLLRCLAGLEMIDRGQILIEGEPISQNQYHNTFVSQDFNLWPHKTVLENVVLAPVLNKRISYDQAVKEAVNLLKRFGLYEKRNSYPDFLSGGQRQRVAIIRALVMKPKVLLLDEITSALDPELVSGVLNLIKILAKEGQSMVIATHHLKFATEVADKIIFMENGSAVQQQTARDFVYAQNNERINSFLKTLSLSSQEITIYEGFDEFQAFQMGMLKRFPVGSTINVAGSSGDRWFESMGPYYKEYEDLRVQKRIAWRMMMYSESALDRDVRMRFPELNEYRLFPKKLENPANYYVIEDTVVIQIFGQSGDKPAIIEIKDPSLAQSYHNYFNLLWEQGTPVK